MSKEIPIDKLKSIWQKSKLLASDIIETPPICFSYESETSKSIIGTLGNFTLITGRAKSRKTFFISVLGAIALNNGTHLGIKASFPDNQKKVLYFDTEQSKYHAKKVLTRILKINKINENEHPENLEFILLRPYSPQTRLDVMDYIIKNTQNVGLVIIDGIKDVVNSINDESEATKTATKLMEWSANYNLHIITVLHQNKNDENSRGHLGTELENKAESVINVRKSDTHPECSEIESKRMRDIDFDKIAFGIDENNVPFETEITEEGITKKKPKISELTDNQIKQILRDVFSKKDYYGWSELRDTIKLVSENLGFFLNENKCSDLIKKCKELKYIELIEKKYSITLDKLW